MTLARGPHYWVFLIILGIALLAVALYYQYILDYAPCVLCIHVRMIIAAIVVISAVALALRRCRLARVAGHLLTAALMVFLAERSWQLLGTERGWVLGSCEMRSGLPAWLAVEDWMPWLFRIHEPCGYTPDLPLGFTMAEVLVGLSFTLTAVAVLLALFAFADLKRHGDRDRDDTR